MRGVAQQHVHRTCSTISSSCRTKSKHFGAQPQPAIHLRLENGCAALRAKPLAGDHAHTPILSLCTLGQKTRKRHTRRIDAVAVQIDFIIDTALTTAELTPRAWRHTGSAELLTFGKTRGIIQHAIGHRTIVD